MKVEVKCMSPNPLEDLCFGWRYMHPEEKRSDKELGEFIAKSDLPLAEGLLFRVMLPEMSVVFERQLIRNRGAAYWIQSGRDLNRGRFFDKKEYFVPQNIRNNPEALARYEESLESSQQCYNDLIQLGMQIEDARFCLPICEEHSGIQFINYRNLLHVFKKRSCHLAHKETWGVFLGAAINELEKHGLWYPPVKCPNESCIYGMFNQDQEDRIRNGESGVVPPCPVWKARMNK